MASGSRPSSSTGNWLQGAGPVGAVIIEGSCKSPYIPCGTPSQGGRVRILRVTQRVVFLDIDGVLAPIRQWDRYGDLDPVCI